MTVKNAWVQELFQMTKFLILVIGSVCVSFTMELPKIGKLYKKDFEQLGVHYIDHLVISDAIDKSRIIDPHPHYETPENIACFTRAIENGYEAPVYIKYINSKVGYGVFAETLLKKGDIVGQYTGTLHTEDEVLKIPKAENTYLMPMVCYAGYNYYESLYIDAKKMGNITRFINHSKTPNVTRKMIYVSGMWHLLLIADQTINQDWQIFDDYGEHYWKSHDIIPEDLVN